MCSGRVDLEFIFRAFWNGQDGILIGGCKLDECNYVTQGNYDALGVTYISKKILARIGLNPARLDIEFMSGSDGNRLAEVVDTFTKKVRELGPIGVAEGIEEQRLKSCLQAVRTLIPYLRLVERQKLRAPVKTEQAYHEFFGSDQVNRLFDELVGDRLDLSRMLSLLQEKPLSTGEISDILRLDPSKVTRHIISSSRQGLVRYDTGSRRYALAASPEWK
jgi:F420-non-reducing hydrogenase iron-sulfur subunit